MSKTRVLFCLGSLLLAWAGAAYSQTTFASITGTVTDATGAVVPGATITATNVETNLKSTVHSNADGNYTIAQLKEGTYTVRAEATGFKSFVADQVGLVARDVRRVDVKMERQSVEALGQEYALRPGMLVNADLLLERRTLLEWIFEPVLQLKGRL